MYSLLKLPPSRFQKSLPNGKALHGLTHPAGFRGAGWKTLLITGSYHSCASCVSVDAHAVPVEPAPVLLERIRAEKEQLIKAGKIKRDKHESVIFRRDNSYYEQVDGIERCIDDELPFEIPKSWEWTRLSTIAKVLGGKRIPAGRKLTAENTGHVYIRVSDMKDGTVIQNGLLYVPEDIFNSISKYIIKKEDVFITVAGTIGRIGKIPPELDGANLTENADRLVFSSLNQDWMIFLLQSSFIQNQIAEVTTKVGQPKLAIARIEKLLIPLPPLNEQTRIVEQIAVIFSQMKKL